MINSKLKNRLYEIVFEADTRAGKLFDVILLITIALSIILVMLESVNTINSEFKQSLKVGEWIITGIFTFEYILRINIVKKKVKYITSFYGVIDLLSILPTFLTFFIPGSHSLSVIRSLRLLRIFRVLKLSRYVTGSKTILFALKSARHKISVFFFFITMIVIIVGSLMYLIEGGESGFTSIPQSIYWAVVTITTVGYGDVAPITTVGKFLAGIMMILGYAIIAVPTGIVSSEFNNIRSDKICTQVCPECLREGHDSDADFCKYCGAEINPEEDSTT